MSSDQSPSRRTILGLVAGVGAWAVSACSRDDQGTVATPEGNQPSAPGGSVAVPSSQSASPSASATPSTTPSATPSSTPTPSAAPGIPGDPLPAGRPANVLVFGTDSRKAGSWSGNNDVVVFLQVSTDRKRVTLVSLPRDLWVPQPPHSNGKLTWALERGGVGFLKSVVSPLMGVPIDYTMQTNFTGFIGLATLFDGFSVNNPFSTTALPDGTFVKKPVPCPKGTLTLHGNDWLAFNRQRKELPLGDLDRTRRHRATMIGMGTWFQRNISSKQSVLTSMVPKVLQNMKLTGGLTNAQLVKLGTMLAGIDPSQTINLMYPVAGFKNSNGQSYVQYDSARAAELKRGLAAGDLRPYVKKYGTSNAPTGGPRG